MSAPDPSDAPVADSSPEDAGISGIRDGDPRALAALCRRHGAAVLAYCEHVASPGHGTAAAADALAHFRLSVVAPGELTARASDELLRSMTRQAGAWRGVNAMPAREGRPVSEHCAGDERGLVGYVDETLPEPERERVDEHLTQCHICRAALGRLQAGERAFQRPPAAPLPRRIAEELVGALVGAAPVRADGGDASFVRSETLRLLVGDEPSRVAEPAQPPLTMEPRPPAPRAAVVAASIKRRSVRPWPVLRGSRRPRLVVVALLAVGMAVAALAIAMLRPSSDGPVPPARSSPLTLGGPGGSDSGSTQTRRPATRARSAGARTRTNKPSTRITPAPAKKAPQKPAAPTQTPESQPPPEVPPAQVPPPPPPPPPSPPPPPAPSQPKPAPSPGGGSNADPGGEFSTNGET